jgi:CheY-like chemotaxis protein
MNFINRLPFIGLLTDMQVLVVDNDHDSAAIYTYLLEDYGATMHIASSVKEAAEILDRLVPNILISEMRFLGESVYTLTQKLRDLEVNTRRHIPVIAATTTYVTDDGRVQILESGFDGYLLKPFDLDELVSMVSSLAYVSTYEIQQQPDWQPRLFAKLTAACN